MPSTLGVDPPARIPLFLYSYVFPTTSTSHYFIVMIIVIIVICIRLKGSFDGSNTKNFFYRKNRRYFLKQQFRVNKTINSFFILLF